MIDIDDNDFPYRCQCCCHPDRFGAPQARRFEKVAYCVECLADHHDSNREWNFYTMLVRYDPEAAERRARTAAVLRGAPTQ